MTEIVTNLLGETIEALDNEGHVKTRGVVRALYFVERYGIHAMVESLGGYHYAETGDLLFVSLAQNRVRPVKQCAACDRWDHQSRMNFIGPTNGWDHKLGEGCRSTT